MGVSCDNANKVKIPAGIMPRDSMASVLTDVHLVKAARQLGLVLDTADSNGTGTFNYVWKKHRITEQQYAKSLDFYTHHPALLDSVYEDALNNLNKERAQLLAKRGINKE